MNILDLSILGGVSKYKAVLSHYNFVLVNLLFAVKTIVKAID